MPYLDSAEVYVRILAQPNSRLLSPRNISYPYVSQCQPRVQAMDEPSLPRYVS